MQPTTPPDHDPNCVFCRIARGELPSSKVYEDADTLAIMDIQSVNPGHMLVLVKPHRANVYALDDALAGAAFRTAARMARVAKEATGCEGVTLLQANEKAGAQTVFHFHLHVLPRWEGDGMALAWPVPLVSYAGGRRPASQSRIPVEHRQVRIRDSEEGTPASGCSFFTVPYSHLAVLNGNPALRGWPATAGVTDEGKRMADETKPTRKGSPPIKVYCLPDERRAIEEKAAAVGMSLSAYLLAVGHGYKITGVVDYEHVRELARINGDLGRLGGLLKLWLTDDPRTARFGDATILALLAKIEEKQDELGKVMMGVVRPRAEP